MKKIVFSILLFANISSSQAFLFFFFKNKKTDFEKVIHDIEKRNIEKLKEDIYNLEDPYKTDFEALTDIIDNKQREIEKEKKKNDGTVRAALLWLGVLVIDGAISYMTGESPAQLVCIATGAVCAAQVAENSYEAFNREHNLKEKEHQCREMKQIVHNAKVSRHLEDKEEKNENREK